MKKRPSKNKGPLEYEKKLIQDSNMFQRTTKEPLSWCFRRYRIMFLVLCVCATNRKKDYTPASPRSLSLSMSHTYILRRTRIHWLHRMCGHKRTYLSFSLSLAFYTLMRLHLNSLSLTLNFVFLFLPLKDVPLTRTCLPTYIYTLPLSPSISHYLWDTNSHAVGIYLLASAIHLCSAV